MSNVETFDEWEKFHIGDKVKVDGIRGAVFTISSFKRNDRGEWADVYGGKSGHASSRSFTLDRLRRIPKKRGSRSS